MKLYGMQGACSLATHIVLEWIGKPYEMHMVGRDELKQAAYLEVNPAGAVPTLEEGDWHLTQNIAILNYLADSYPESGLGGDGSARARAEINHWLGVVNSDMHPAFKPLFGATGYLEDATVIARTKAHAATVLRGQFERVDTALAGRDWLTGSRSIVDPYLYVLLRWAKALKLDMNGLGHLEAFFGRMQADAGVHAALKAEGLA